MSYPTFDELPQIEQLGLRHSWSVFGPDDEVGTVNFLTPDGVVDGARGVQEGRVVNLSLPIGEPDPPLFAREPHSHEVFQLGRNSWDDKLDNLFLQGSTQWDGLLHQRCREFGFYGGRQLEPHEGNPEGVLGISRWAEHGVAGRGVLLDVAGHLAVQDHELDPFAARSISATMLEEVAEAQGVPLAPGTVLCVRVGWLEAYRALPREERAALKPPLGFPGLAADEAMARFLWDNRVAAVAVDNPTVEVSPGDPDVGSLHRRLLPCLGMALGELFWLRDLAALCRERSRWEFLFVSVPLNLPGGVGSPANAVAIL